MVEWEVPSCFLLTQLVCSLGEGTDAWQVKEGNAELVWTYL